MNLFNLVAKLTLDDSDYVNGISSAKKSADSLAASTGKSSKGSALAMGTVGVAAADVTSKINTLTTTSIASGLKTAAGWAGVALSVSAIVTSLKDAIYNTTEWAGGIKDLAQVYGRSYTEIQEVNYLAQESGKNAEWALRKAQSSGMEYWEVLGLTNEQYQEMIGYANEMGIILGDDVIDGADRLGDQISQLKYQWQSLLAGLLAGDENAEENLQKFFDRIMAFLEEFMPVIMQFVAKLLVNIAVAAVKLVPQLTVEIINVLIDTIFSINWVEVGWNIIKSIVQGIINGFLKLGLGWLGKLLGFEVPQLDLGVGQSSIDVGNNYEITERSTQELTIKVESNGVTANDKAVANSLETIIDKKIGEMLGGI